jgi:hypothetical protein
MAKPNKPKLNQPADFSVENHGSLFLLRPHTPRAKAWMKHEVHAEPYQFFGDALAIEHRYISEIVRKLIDEGFIVI